MAQNHSPSVISTSSDLAELYPQVARRAERYANWMIGNQADAEEIVQEAFCRLAQKEQEGRGYPSEQLGNVLFTIVRRLCVDFQRRQVRRKQVPLTSVGEPGTSNPKSEAAQLQKTIDGLMQELPSTWAEALKLKLTGELTYEEIASVMQSSHAQVRTWIFRARKQLSERLSQLGWI